MKKITDIIIQKEGVRESRDENGNVIRERVMKDVKRKVNVVQGGKRFGHYLIDLVIIIGISFGGGFLYYSINPPEYMPYENTGFSLDLSGYLITFGFYFVFEAALGKTPGKFVTRCRVIDEYCEKPNAGAIFIRSISRLVPFEGFSCLGERGWHDTWSKTYLVSEEEYEKLRKHLGKSASSEDILDAGIA